jgi:hypothetical protein
VPRSHTHLLIRVRSEHPEAASLATAAAERLACELDHSGEHGGRITVVNISAQPQVELASWQLEPQVARLEITPQQLQALRDGHAIHGTASDDTPVELTLGDFSEADLEILARREVLTLTPAGEDLPLQLSVTAAIYCEECGERVVTDPQASEGVWVHDAEALGDRAFDLNEQHAARPPEHLA